MQRSKQSSSSGGGGSSSSNNNNNNNSIKFISILVYICANLTAQRPIMKLTVNNFFM
jgi:hypothetical protein